MTDERKNEIWEYLPNDIRRKLQRDYIKACEAQEFDPHNDRIYAHRMFMQKYFGKDNLEECKELNDYNLTTQAEEKPRVPKFKVGDKVYVPWLTHKRKATITEIGTYGYTVIDFENNTLRNFMESELEPYTPASKDATKDATKDASQDAKPSQEKPLDVAESVETSTKEDAYVDIVPKSDSDEDIREAEDNLQKIAKLNFGGTYISPKGEIFVRHDIDYAAYRLDLAKEIAVAMVHVFNQAYQDIPEDAVTITNEIVKRLKETE